MQRSNMLFVSHSSLDVYVVEPLIDLIRVALGISPDRIRCSSLGGYQLAGGANIDDTLRQEVSNAAAFIGILSYNSIQSTYVTFELGARWGANKTFIPLTVPGVRADILTGPLSTLNVLSCEKADQLHQLLGQLSMQLEVEHYPPASYQRKIDQILSLPKTSKVQIPEYISKYLDLELAVRREALPNSQKEILGYIITESKRRESVPQNECEEKFKGRFDSIYWRLEFLCLLGFIEKEITNRRGNTPTYNYRLTKEFKALR